MYCTLSVSKRTRVLSCLLRVSQLQWKKEPSNVPNNDSAINEVAENTPTNIGIFAASFEVLNALLTEGLENSLQKPLFHERRGMTSKANEKMVSDFKACGGKGGAVFLGVQGRKNLRGRGFSRQPNELCNSSGCSLC
jgi:Rad3-related DNA helicase